jgi:hypothetical protein
VVGNRDAAAMGDDDRLADGQADSQAGVLGGEEAVEDPVQVVAGDTGPGVTNREGDGAAVGARAETDPSGRPTALGDGLDAVD